jgi:chemotaxis protein MotB
VSEKTRTKDDIDVLENTGDIVARAGLRRRAIFRSVALVVIVAGVGAGITAAFLNSARNAANTRASTAEASLATSMETVRAQKAQLEELKGRVERLERENAELLELKTKLTSDVAAKEDELAKQAAERAQLAEKMKNEIKSGEVALSDDGGRLRVDLIDKILFDSGDATISKRGQEVLTKVGAVLGQVQGKRIQVSGHTDDSPPSGKTKDAFPTNWELSTTRATNVVRYLSESAGVPARMLVATGYGQFRPVATNANPTGRARNRRIEILLVPEIEAVRTNAAAAVAKAK